MKKQLSSLQRQHADLAKKSARARRRRTLTYIERVLRNARSQTDEERVLQEIYVAGIAEDKARRPDNNWRDNKRYRAMKGKS